MFYNPRLDPNSATREEFTNNLLAKQIPANADNDWKTYATNLKDLLPKLAFHDPMGPNLQQTYMTPAASKNKIYFMWDFIGRTLGFLYMFDPSVGYETSQGQQNELWSDVVSRSVMGAGLLLDDKPGMLDMMVEGTYPTQSGPRPVVGEEVLEAARKLKG